MLVNVGFSLASCIAGLSLNTFCITSVGKYNSCVTVELQKYGIYRRQAHVLHHLNKQITGEKGNKTIVKTHDSVSVRAVIVTILIISRSKTFFITWSFQMTLVLISINFKVT